MEIIGYVITDIILSSIGWVYLYAWYRDKKKIEKIKDEKYAGRFSTAGRVLILNLIAGAGAIAMFGVAITILVMWIYQSIAK
jgi:hypothetical protein